MAPVAPDQQRVAVRSGLGDVLGGDDGAGARLVLDQHRLAQPLAQLLADQAREDVVAAAGPEADDDADRLGRIAPRRVALRQRRHAGGTHRRPPLPAAPPPRAASIHASSACPSLAGLVRLSFPPTLAPLIKWGVSRDPVIVVGAGIGGLSCALALRQRGIDVEVYEQAPELREIGAGVQISANGTRVLRALGLEAALDAWAVRPQAKEIRHWKSGTHLEALRPRRRLGAALRRALHLHPPRRSAPHSGRCACRYKPDGIHLNARCVGVEQDADAVTLRLEDGRSARGRLLIGADGVHSAVRASVFGAGRPEFTGCMAWRGVIPRDRSAAGSHTAGRHQLDRPRPPRRALSAAARRGSQFCRRRGAQRLADRILDRARHARGMPRRFRRLAPGCARA